MSADAFHGLAVGLARGLSASRTERRISISGTNAFGVAIDVTVPVEAGAFLETTAAVEPKTGNPGSVHCLLLEGILEFADSAIDLIALNPGFPVDDIRRRNVSYGFGISERAFSHALSFRGHSPGAIFSHLYRYGAQPITATCPTLLGLSKVEESVSEKMREAFSDVGWFGPWKVFKNGGETSWKVYISVERESFLSVVHDIVPALRDQNVSALKISFTPEGVSRPDNLMIYLPSLTSCLALVKRLAQILPPDRTFPLPFAMQTGFERDIGIGFDRNSPLVIDSKLLGGSWRSNICQILTRAILNSAGHSERVAKEYALRLLSAHGFGFDASLYDGKQSGA